MRLQGARPYFLSPLVSTAQKIVVSRPGEEPSISHGLDHIEENMRLAGRVFHGMSRCVCVLATCAARCRVYRISCRLTLTPFFP